MRRAHAIGLLTLLLVGLLFAPDAPAAQEPITRFTLGNGLRVALRPIEGAERVAVVVLYDIGEDHDPEGASGLGHLIEHCYVTAKAGDTPMRTASQMMGAYPQAWNAQTGADYTVIAFIVPKARLASELQEAASRMRFLEVTAADLEREKPRMRQELHNMFEGVPALAARNRATELVRPSAVGARRGGVIEQVETIGLGVVRTRLAKHYKPLNARLVLAGGFDVDEAGHLVKEHFASIAKGEPLSAPRSRPAPRLGETSTVKVTPLSPALPGQACAAFAAPPPGSDFYAPFLVLVSRFFANQQRASGPTGTMGQYAPIDAPDVMYVARVVGKGETTQSALQALRDDVQKAIEAPLTPADVRMAKNTFGFLLGLNDVPDMLLRQNPYGVAFRIGRSAQLGLDREEIAAALRAVDEKSLGRAADTIFADANGSTVVVLTK